MAARNVSASLWDRLSILTSVFEPEETEKRRIDEGNNKDQGVDLHSLTCRRDIGSDKDEGKESTGKGTVYGIAVGGGG